MNRRGTGLLLTSVAALIWSVAVPELPATGPAANGAHLLAGSLLGLGMVVTFHSLFKGRGRSTR